jgi:accessory gene regulator B
LYKKSVINIEKVINYWEESMIKYLSENITEYFFVNKIINNEEKEIYIYGLQLIFSTIIGITIILTLGLVLSRIEETVVFLFAFISIRMYSGGYHANTYLKCNLILIIIFSIFTLTVTFTPQSYINIVSIALILSTIYIILKYAPVENHNKRMTSSQKRKNKKITIYLLSIFYIIGIAIHSVEIRLFYSIIVTLFLVAILIITNLNLKGVQQ